MKCKLIFSYDGTRFCGFQRQSNGLSIQHLVEEALGTALRRPTSIIGAGRTDAGVHARGQVAHFTSEGTRDLKRLLLSLNGLLPPDIRILSIEEVNEDFHARYSARSKIYHYHIHLGAVQDPFKKLYCAHFHFPVDFPLLKSAIPFFLGKRDFTSFAHEATRGAAAKNPYKTIYRIDAIEEEGGFRVEFEADGFLYKMVRNIVGTLLQVGSGKCSLEEIPLIFSARDRKKAASTAPSQGLFLHKVMY
jgi:tRNA pseudouridine38-40 synthase